jgi:hypothetical protein
VLFASLGTASLWVVDSLVWLTEEKFPFTFASEDVSASLFLELETSLSKPVPASEVSSFNPCPCDSSLTIHFVKI